MKLLRNRFVNRTMSVFLLLVFVQSVFMPEYAFALTSGPHQPEYTSYEEPGATDMVNLLTGDFGFNIPLIEVLGPEGNFSLPLSYHAGIGLEQEASWVGLGWNANVGAIVRSINQYPDDAQGEANTVTVQNLTGVNGYDVQWSTPFKQSWNSVQGKYGNVNLLDIVEVEWGRKSSVGIMGVHVGDDPGVNFQQFASSAMTVASLGAAGSMQAVIKQVAMQISIQASAAMTGAAIQGTLSSAGTSGHWNSNFRNRTSLALSGNPLTGFLGLKNTWKTWLDRTRQEDMYGVLYAHKPNLVPMNTVADIGFGGWAGTKISINGNLQNTLPSFEQSTNTIERGSASDISFSVNEGSTYQSQNNPVLLANDQYNVQAPGISGSISPYRLEVGSVSMPREMTDKHIRLAPVPYLDYKVPFTYEGSATNEYLHHGGGTAAPTTPYANYYGIPKTGGGTITAWGTTYRHTEFDIQDHTLTTERIKSDVAASKKIAQGNHIEWLSNQEIASGTIYANKFLDFLPAGAARSNFRATAPNGIGGYCITSADGQMYHFALPVYTLNETSESVRVTDSNQKSIITRNSPFATTWLLTAITGPDFIDRNGNGMADNDDWGYWMKFNYGKHVNNYDWRIPYENTALDPSGHFRNYTKGQKQLYYLNSIESRSHVALLIKSTRADGLSAENTGIAQLKLDEIVLLKKENYESARASFWLPDYSNGIDAVCTPLHINQDMRNYLNQNCLKRVLFTYDYSLCKNTTNAGGSANPAKGKLTLTRVSIKGRNNVSLHPDYKFEYSNNPDYGAHKWDGWGMYNPGGTDTPVTSHRTSDPNDLNGAAWSLTKIVTPLGGNLAVEYERDSYGSASGQDILDQKAYFSSLSAFTIPSTLEPMKLEPSSTTGFSINDKVLIEGVITRKCPEATSATPTPYTATYTIKSVTPTTLTLYQDYTDVIECYQTGAIQIESHTGTLTKIPTNKKGGNIRVKSIIMEDELGRSNIMRYYYNKDDGTSSGVVAQEPPFIRMTNLSFYNRLNYPETPVMYGQVTVEKGESEFEAFTSRQIFKFETPSTSQYSLSTQNHGSAENLNDGYLFTISDRTSQIGRLNYVSTQDENGSAVSSAWLYYNDASHKITNNTGSNYQGYYTEGTVLFEMLNAAGKTIINGNGGSAYWVFLPDLVKINRTTLVRHPNALRISSITQNKNGHTYTLSDENLKWDFISGQVIEKISKSALGVKVKTVLVPAYHLQPYASMGPKASDINNKNMLTQIAGRYMYKVDDMSNPTGLIGASVQTWKNNWANYRHFDGNAYGDHNEQISIDNPVWRQGPAHTWRGNYANLQADGTRNFNAATDDFNFTNGAANPSWLYTGENTRFDHYGMPLESKDRNDIFSAVKMGYRDRTAIASASNASFNEIAFSSAEDRIHNQNFFGGEVGFHSATSTVVTAPVHTGYNALSVSAGGYGFLLRSSGLTPGKAYRASVWCSSTDGRIYYKINGAEVIPSPIISNAVNVGGVSWYRIDLAIPAQSVTSTSMEIGTKSVGGNVVFDDFRFQPAASKMSCYVHPPLPHEFSSPGQPVFDYVLNDDNLFTKFEYDERGALARTYSESLIYGVKLVSESKQNFRRSHVNQ